MNTHDQLEEAWKSVIESETDYETCQPIRIAIINDLHLDPLYNPSMSSNSLCREMNAFYPNKTTSGIVYTELFPQAMWGRYGCDAPESLVELMINHLATE